MPRNSAALPIAAISLSALAVAGCASKDPALRVARQALTVAEKDYQTWLLVEDLSPAQRAELALSRARTMVAAREAVEEALDD